MDSEGWDRRYADTELVWSAEPNRFVAAETADLPPGRALDLACGEGRNAVWLAERGWDVTGVDFSQAGLDKAARLAEQRGVRAHWVRADLREYAAPPQAFDLVVVVYLQVVAPVRRAIHEQAARAVAAGGLLLVVGHDASNPEHGYGGPQDPAVLFTAQEVAADVPELEIERAEQVLRPVRSPSGPMTAIDALVCARKPLLRRPATPAGPA